MKFISFYTSNTRYEQLALRLLDSLAGFNLPYVIKPVTDRRSWEKNTHQKAIVIKEMLERFAPEPIVYIDADAIVIANPVLFYTLSCDIAVHYHNHMKKGKELLGGTIYLANNEKTIKLVDRWIELNRLNPCIFEQENLSRAVREMPELSVVELPAQYCWIFDWPHRPADVMIEHYQASRKMGTQ